MIMANAIDWAAPVIAIVTLLASTSKVDVLSKTGKKNQLNRLYMQCNASIVFT